MTKEDIKQVNLLHKLDVKFNKLSLREHLIVEEATKELQEENKKIYQRMTGLDEVLVRKNEQIEKMKCCGNCKYAIEEYGEFTCPFTKDNNFCSIAYNTENNSLWESKE